ncbi:O-acetyltransferase OatA [Planctomycetes bacterium CA13]|uniref:O-acetyltransferase OatA n=1 Tax=Novipirellula herctigrandis TaxID=2527986 RepID=A0A5C5YWI1_9BACT|nr:O-acetyltransferase OatA [Planctomycetes bacterium CA13]
MLDFKYRSDVDGLRAVAVVLVLLFHAELGFTGGYIGVDVFFVISGFLITGLIVKQQRAGKFSLANFWSRRIRRILPASVFVVICTLVAGWFLLFPSDYRDLAQSALSQQLMLSNVYFWRNTGYFVGDAELKPLLHTWSLAVEEQFYLFYPFVLVLLRRASDRTLVTLLGLATLVSLLVSQWGVLYHPGATFFLLPTRAWELSLGGLLCFTPPSQLRSRTLAILNVAGLLAICVAAWFFDSTTPFPGFHALLPCLGTAACIYTNAAKLTWCGKLLSARPIVMLGLMSYSLYLWHWPLLAYARYALDGNLPAGVAMTALVVSLLLAYLSWRFVEQPFRKNQFGFANRSLVLGIGGCSMAVVVLAAVVVSSNGFQDRVSEKTLAYRRAKKSIAFVQQVKTADIQRGGVPTFGSDSGKSKCLVWGDSHAMALVPAINAACEQSNIKGFQATYSATAPLLDFVYPTAAGLNDASPVFNDAVVRFAVEQQVDIVILAGVWSQYAENADFESALRNTIKRLRANDIQVAVVLDVVSHDADITLTLAHRASRSQDTANVGASDDAYQSKNRECNDVIFKVAEGEAFVIEPRNALTNRDSFWPAQVDDVVLYRDGYHLSIEGALRLTPMFVTLFASIQKDIVAVNMYD